MVRLHRRHLPWQNAWVLLAALATLVIVIGPRVSLHNKQGRLQALSGGRLEDVVVDRLCIDSDGCVLGAGPHRR